MHSEEDFFCSENSQTASATVILTLILLIIVSLILKKYVNIGEIMMLLIITDKISI